MEMARRYPHASVVGIDLTPPPLDVSSIPSNLRFEIDDVNKGLRHFYNHVDVVHVRCIISGIQDYATMMKETEKCLKPGGLVIFMDGDLRILSQDQLHSVKFPYVYNALYTR
jgi:2-polyprenyl-3-methyl-5-hydroxy-6-metoxy-1,4-benzoquinol methylase